MLYWFFLVFVCCFGVLPYQTSQRLPKTTQTHREIAQNCAPQRHQRTGRHFFLFPLAGLSYVRKIRPNYFSLNIRYTSKQKKQLKLTQVRPCPSTSLHSDTSVTGRHYVELVLLQLIICELAKQTPKHATPLPSRGLTAQCIPETGNF